MPVKDQQLPLTQSIIQAVNMAFGVGQFKWNGRAIDQRHGMSGG